MDLKEIGISTKNWVDSAQDREYWRALVNAVLNLRIPYAIELISVPEIPCSQEHVNFRRCGEKVAFFDQYNRLYR